MGAIKNYWEEMAARTVLHSQLYLKFSVRVTHE